MKYLNYKLLSLDILFIILLTFLYTIVISGFVNIFYNMFNIPFETVLFSLIITIIGIGLGVIFYFVSFLKTTYRNYIITGVLISICIIFAIPYLQLRINALEDSALMLLKIGIFFGLCSIPIPIVYAYIKKRNDILFISNVMIMFFFCYARFLNNDFLILKNNNELLILFFLTFLCFIELGYKQLYFKSVIARLTSNTEEDNITLLKFNKSINLYLMYFGVFLIAGYLVTYLFYWSNTSIGLFNTKEILNVNLSSTNTTLIFVILLLISLMIFFFISPIRKTEKKVEEN